jgi:hypothetical protein
VFHFSVASNKGCVLLILFSHTNLIKALSKILRLHYTCTALYFLIGCTLGHAQPFTYTSCFLRIFLFEHFNNTVLPRFSRV